MMDTGHFSGGFGHFFPTGVRKQVTENAEKRTLRTDRTLFSALPSFTRTYERNAFLLSGSVRKCPVYVTSPIQAGRMG